MYAYAHIQILDRFRSNRATSFDTSMLSGRSRYERVTALIGLAVVEKVQAPGVLKRKATRAGDHPHPLRDNVVFPFFKRGFALCLSRACLGKMIILVLNGGKDRVLTMRFLLFGQNRSKIGLNSL